MRKEMLCVLGVLVAACAVQAQQWPAGYDTQAYYQGQVQPVQMAPGGGNGGYGPYYYPNNYAYAPSYPPNYGYGANYGYGMNYNNGAGVPSGAVQMPSDLPPTTGVADGPVADTVAGPPTAAGVAGAPKKTFWVSTDYLLSSIQRGPLRTPLVTLGSLADNPNSGQLGQPNTTVVFGANNLDNRLFHGIQGEAGMYLDGDHMFSLEGAGFYLFPNSMTTAFASDATGNPLIARPFINSLGGIAAAEQTSIPGAFTGSTTVETRTKLYGFEANARCNACLSPSLNADILTGFRFLRLDESLVISDRLTPIPNTGLPGAGLTFLGAPIDDLSSLADRDSFTTSNTFYGLNLGTRLRWQRDWIFVSAFGKVALGVTEERVHINGTTTLFSPAGNQTTSGGVLALPTNIGNFNRSVFGVVPEAGFTIGVQPINHVRIQAGYSILYWNAVARPGDQIDPRLNRGLIPTDQNFGTAGTAGAHPVFEFQDKTFRVQNLTAGIEFYY